MSADFAMFFAMQPFFFWMSLTGILFSAWLIKRLLFD